MVAGNNRFDAFDGVVYDRHGRQFRTLDRFEILGRPTELNVFGQPATRSVGENDGRFDRQKRIPGWNQEGLERQRMGTIGVGGNGAHLLETLLGIGAGRQGFVAIVDDDSVEASNLPRIPCACPEHVRTPKVSVAVQYAGRKSPGTPVFPFPCRFAEQAVQSRMKMATVLFYAGDNDGGRKELNEFAVRYGIPLIDLGCDIQVSEHKVVAGGQVRTVLPGHNACLVCCRGFDPSQAALDQMSRAARARHAAQGYVQGSETSATPSVANLNGLTAHFALSQFLAMVNGESFATWDYLHFDQFTGQTIPAQTTRQENCPVCGPGGCLAAGDPVEQPRRDATFLTRLPTDLSPRNASATPRARRRKK